MDYFGIREVCNVTLRSLRNIPACRSMTGKDVRRGEPVMYFDYLKVSNISGSITTVYATGGRGNARRLSWDGDKEITFHIEDALISPTSMAILTAAQLVRRRVARVNRATQLAGALTFPIVAEPGLIRLELPLAAYDPLSFMSWGVIVVDITGGPAGVTQARIFTGDMEVIRNDDSALPHAMIINQMRTVVAGATSMGDVIPITSDIEITGITRFEVLEATSGRPVYKHEKYRTVATDDGVLQLKHIPWRDQNHPLFIFDVQHDGSIDLIDSIDHIGTMVSGVDYWKSDPNTIGPTSAVLDPRIIHHPQIYKGNDYLVDYYREVRGNVTSLVITADGTSDYYMLEGETLMRREVDGQDVPVMITIPKVKPRAQFEIPMSATGDPSTFSFDFDVFPARNHNFEACADNVMVIIDIIEDDDGDCVCTYDQLEIWQAALERKQSDSRSVHYEGNSPWEYTPA